jgi:hypothetical protein
VSSVQSGTSSGTGKEDRHVDRDTRASKVATLLARESCVRACVRDSKERRPSRPSTLPCPVHVLFIVC